VFFCLVYGVAFGGDGDGWFMADHTWLERAEITQPCTGLQSRSKSRLQFSGGLSFASAITSHYTKSALNSIHGGGKSQHQPGLTDKMPALSERLTLPNRVRPNRRIADIESFRWLEEVLDKLRSVLREEVLGQVPDGAVAETAPGDCLAGEGEEGEGC
jgi:hypothetical protein